MVNFSFQDLNPLSLLLKITWKDLYSLIFLMLGLTQVYTGSVIILVALLENSLAIEFAGIPPGLPE